MATVLAIYKLINHSLCVLCVVQGVPVRIELGPKDLEKQQFVAVKRVNGQKVTLPLDGAAQAINTMLDDIHDVMFAK